MHLRTMQIDAHTPGTPEVHTSPPMVIQELMARMAPRSTIMTMMTMVDRINIHTIQMAVIVMIGKMALEVRHTTSVGNLLQAQF